MLIRDAQKEQEWGNNRLFFCAFLVHAHLSVKMSCYAFRNIDIIIFLYDYTRDYFVLNV